MNEWTEKLYTEEPLEIEETETEVIIRKDIEKVQGYFVGGAFKCLETTVSMDLWNLYQMMSEEANT